MSRLDIKKMIMSGVKTFLYVIGGLLVGALTLAIGLKPEGLVNQFAWTYICLPMLAGAIAMLKNWIQHKDDK